MDNNEGRAFIRTFADKICFCMADKRDDKGRFISGHKKTGGMKKGYEAPVKKEFRELMADFSRVNYDKFCFAMTQCEPKDFCKFYLESLKFNLPMLQSVSLENMKQVANDFTDVLRKLSEESD